MKLWATHFALVCEHCDSSGITCQRTLETFATSWPDARRQFVICGWHWGSGDRQGRCPEHEPVPPADGEAAR
jgi:hypothetical protein